MWFLFFTMVGCFIIAIIFIFVFMGNKSGGSSWFQHSPETPGVGWTLCYDWVPLQASWDDAAELCGIRNSTLSAMVPDEVIALLINVQRGDISADELIASTHYAALQTLKNETGQLPLSEASKFTFFELHYDSIFEEDTRRIWSSNRTEDHCDSVKLKKTDLSYELEPVKCDLKLAYICQSWQFGFCESVKNKLMDVLYNATIG